jgi:hypothetical protein
MNQRVEEREWIQYQWEYLLTLLGGEARVTRLAYETGAFTRRRKIESPADLLRLILTWAVAEKSLMETAAMAAEVDLADVSDVALLRRFVRAETWLGALLGDVLIARNAAPRLPLSIRLIDATSISSRGSKGTERRIHLSMDLGSNRTTAIEITDRRGAESLERFALRPGEILLADRGYGNRKELSHAARAGSYFIVPFPWSNLPLEHADGTPFDLFAALRSLPEAQAGEFSVSFRASDGQRISCRLVAVRKSEPAAERERNKLLAYNRRHGNPKIEVRTLEAAGYVFVLTNLPTEISAASVLDLYRFRWQVEMKFKTLKSAFHLGKVPTRNSDLLNVYLYAKLLVALLIEDLIDNDESFPPWGYPIPPDSYLAPHAPAA